MTAHSGSPGAVDLALRLLDHQIVGASGALLGNVDNCELRDVDGQLMVTGLMTGPAALGPRQPGRLGRWSLAAWRRLRPDAEPRPVVLPLDHVTRIGSAVHVSAWGEAVLDQSMGLEHWLRPYVARIPGATGGEDRLAAEPLWPRREHPELLRAPGGHLVSDLLGARVVGADGSGLGAVLDVTATPLEQSGLEVGRLRVDALTFGPHALGAKLGYTSDPRLGPWLLAALFRRVQRGNRRVPLADVAAIDWATRTVRLSPGARLEHPHLT